MKKIIIAILLCYSSNVIAQTPSPYDSNKVRQPEGMYGKNASNYKFGTIVIPTDTVKMAARDSGAIAYKESKLYLWNGRYWTIPATGSSINIGNSNLTLTGNRVLDCDGEMFQLYHPAPFSIITYSGLVLGVQADSLSMNENIILRKNGQATFRDGTQSDGYVYTCDADGNGSWQPSSGGGGSTTLQGAIDNSPLLDKDNTIDGGGYNQTDSNFAVRKFEGGVVEINTGSSNSGFNDGYIILDAGDPAIQLNNSDGSVKLQASNSNLEMYNDKIDITLNNDINNPEIHLDENGITLKSSPIAFTDYPDSLTSNYSILGRDITTGKIGVIAGGGGGSGTVTSVATGYGLSGGTITTSGTLLVDSATLSTKYLRITDTANMRVRLVAGTNITNISGTYPNLTINAATQTTDTTSLSSRINLKANIASPTFTGTVTIPSGGVFGTPTSVTLTNATGLPISTGVSGLGTGIATWLGTPSWTNFNSAITGTAPYWSLASGGTLTGTNTITAGSNPLILSTGVTTGTGATAGHQIVANSLTSGNANDYSSSSITTGNILKLTSTSTAANAFSLLNINSSGANANSARTATGQTISVTNTGTTSINVGLSVSASGATNNYGLLVPNGMVGIGTTTPTIQFQVEGATAGARFIRSGGNEAFIQLTEPTLAFGGGIRGNAAAAGIQFTNLSSSIEWARFDGSTGIGRFGIGVTSPTSLLHLAAGTATAGTAPLGFTTTSAALLTTPVAGKMEVLVDSIYYTGSGANRRQLTQSLYGTATLDFGNTAAGTSTDLTVTVTGAADGDVVSLGVVNASTVANGSFSAWVSAANTVTVRYANNSLVTAYDPASGAFKIRVIK